MAAWSKAKIIDLVERTGATFLQAFLAVLVVGGNLSDWTAVKVALVAGGLAVVKFLNIEASKFLAGAYAAQALSDAGVNKTTFQPSA
jgi:hypothetical protein